MPAPNISPLNIIYYCTFGLYSIIVTETAISVFFGWGEVNFFCPRLPFFFALIFKKVIIFVFRSAERHNC